MLYTAQKDSLVGYDGQPRRLAGSLIKNPGKPDAGWQVNLKINGSVMQVRGNDPVQVFNATNQLLKANGITLNAASVWLSLNIQWFARTPRKHHLVPEGDLLLIAGDSPPQAAAEDSRRRNYKPSDWGSRAWLWLGLWLARDSFSYREFLHQCEVVLNMLNPAANPSLGCMECYTEWSKHVELLRTTPEMTQQEAREWLFNSHNTVNSRLGKRTPQWKEAAKANFWE